MSDSEKVVYEIEVHSSKAKQQIDDFKRSLNSAMDTSGIRNFANALNKLPGQIAGSLGASSTAKLKRAKQGWISPAFTHTSSRAEGQLSVTEMIRSFRDNRRGDDFISSLREWSRQRLAQSENGNVLGLMGRLFGRGRTGTSLIPVGPNRSYSAFAEYMNHVRSVFGRANMVPIYDVARGDQLYDEWPGSIGHLAPWQRSRASNETVDAQYTLNDIPGGGGGGRRRGGFWSRFAWGVPRGAGGQALHKMAPFLGALGPSMLGFIGAISIVTGLFKVLASATKFLFGTFKGAATDAYRFYRTREMLGGLTGGELSDISMAGIISGGSAKENQALMARIASDRAGLLWGGNGGSFMEAASRFGVDVRGSGPGGLATEMEWLRNISERMTQLDPSGRLALANATGLNREQMWLVSHGPEYFDWATSQRTLAQSAYGQVEGLGGDVYSQNFQEESRNFYSSWAMFEQSAKELFSSIAEVLIPVANIILETLASIFQLLSMILKPIAAAIGKVLSLLNISFWENKAAMEKDAKMSGNVADYGLLWRYGGGGGGRPPIVTSVGDIHISTTSGNPQDIANEVVSEIARFTEDIYSQIAGMENIT